MLTYAVGPAQVLLRWSVQQGLAVIPKSNNHDRLLSNLQVTEFTLSDEQMKALDELDINLRVSDLCVSYWSLKVILTLNR